MINSHDITMIGKILSPFNPLGSKPTNRCTGKALLQMQDLNILIPVLQKGTRSNWMDTLSFGFRKATCISHTSGSNAAGKSMSTLVDIYL